MAVDITHFSQQGSSPNRPGAVVVREVAPGHSEVRFFMKDGPAPGAVVYSSYLGCGDDFERAVEWAIQWSAVRGIPRIYVEARRDQKRPEIVLERRASGREAGG